MRFRTAEVNLDGMTDFHYSPIALNMKRRKGKEAKGKEGKEGKEKKSQKRDSSINDLLLVMMRVVRW